MSVSLKIGFFTGILGCFLVFISPTDSLKCYRKVCLNNKCHGPTGEMNCGEGYDKCGTLTYTAGSSSVFLLKNCAISARDCSREALSDRLRAHVRKNGETLKEFSIACCDRDMCNAPAEKKSAMSKKHGNAKQPKGEEGIQEKLVKLVSSFDF